MIQINSLSRSQGYISITLFVFTFEKKFFFLRTHDSRSEGKGSFLVGPTLLLWKLGRVESDVRMFYMSYRRTFFYLKNIGLRSRVYSTFH